MPQPAEDVLRQTPEAYEPWQGLSKMDLKVCVVRGPKITISPKKLAEFQHAPLSISEEVRRLEAEHQEYEDRLAFMASASTNPEPETDPRPKMMMTSQQLTALLMSKWKVLLRWKPLHQV